MAKGPGTRGANRAEELRTVAFDMFSKRGFDATSMDSIALAAGVSKRTPYIYFKNKHDLFSAVVLVFLEEVERRLDAVWDSAASGIEALRSAMEVYAAYAIENPAHFDLIMTFERRDFYPGRTQELPVNSQACQDVNDRITERMYEAIAAAKRAGELKTDHDAKQFGLLLWSSLVGVVSIAVERRALLPDVYGWTAREMVHAHVAHFFGSSTNVRKRNEHWKRDVQGGGGNSAGPRGEPVRERLRGERAGGSTGIKASGA